MRRRYPVAAAAHSLVSSLPLYRKEDAAGYVGEYMRMLRNGEGRLVKVIGACSGGEYYMGSGVLGERKEVGDVKGGGVLKKRESPGMSWLTD